MNAKALRKEIKAVIKGQYVRKKDFEKLKAQVKHLNRKPAQPRHPNPQLKRSPPASHPVRPMGTICNASRESARCWRKSWPSWESPGMHRSLPGHRKTSTASPPSSTSRDALNGRNGSNKRQNWSRLPTRAADRWGSDHGLDGAAPAVTAFELCTLSSSPEARWT